MLINNFFERFLSTNQYFSAFLKIALTTPPSLLASKGKQVTVIKETFRAERIYIFSSPPMFLLAGIRL